MREGLIVRSEKEKDIYIFVYLILRFVFQNVINSGELLEVEK